MSREIRSWADKMCSVALLFVCVKNRDADTSPSSRSSFIALEESLKLDLDLSTCSASGVAICCPQKVFHITVIISAVFCIAIVRSNELDRQRITDSTAERGSQFGVIHQLNSRSLHWWCVVMGLWLCPGYQVESLMQTLLEGLKQEWTVQKVYFVLNSIRDIIGSICQWDENVRNIEERKWCNRNAQNKTMCNKKVLVPSFTYKLKRKGKPVHLYCTTVISEEIELVWSGQFWVGCRVCWPQLGICQSLEKERAGGIFW